MPDLIHSRILSVAASLSFLSFAFPSRPTSFASGPRWLSTNAMSFCSNSFAMLSYWNAFTSTSYLSLPADNSMIVLSEIR